MGRSKAPREACLLPIDWCHNSHRLHAFQPVAPLAEDRHMVFQFLHSYVPPRLDPYDHLDIMRNYSQLIQYIEKVLGEIEESYTVIPFTLNERVFTLQLQSAWVGDRLVLGARAHPGMTSEDLIQWIKNCVIVTDKYITIAKDDRVLGASRKFVSEVSTMNLVSTKGVQLFIIDVDPRYIDPRGVLCLFNFSDDDSSRPLEVVLYHSNR